MKNQKGITLIALIITIIVLLILAGVSINAVVGDNGVITQSQIASLETRYAGYKEELEMNLVSVMADQGLKETNKITVLNDGVKTYIPSLKDEDVGKFGVINGKLYYINSDEMGISVAKSQGIEVIPEGKSCPEKRTGGILEDESRSGKRTGGTPENKSRSGKRSEEFKGISEQFGKLCRGISGTSPAHQNHRGCGVEYPCKKSDGLFEFLHQRGENERAAQCAGRIARN